MQLVDFFLRPNSARSNQLSRRGLSQRTNHILGKALQQTFRIHMRVQKGSAPRFERLNHLRGADVSYFSPSLDRPSTANRVHRKNQPIGADRVRRLFCEHWIKLLLSEQCRTQDNSLRSRRQCSLSGRNRADASTNLAGPLAGEMAEQFDSV